MVVIDLQIFEGGWHVEMPHVSLLETPVLAKYIRVMPIAAAHNVHGFRFGVLGCTSSTSQTKG